MKNKNRKTTSRHVNALISVTLDGFQMKVASIPGVG
jgi:hypothetical protein